MSFTVTANTRLAFYYWHAEEWVNASLLFDDDDELTGMQSSDGHYSKQALVATLEKLGLVWKAALPKCAITSLEIHEDMEEFFDQNDAKDDYGYLGPHYQLKMTVPKDAGFSLQDIEDWESARLHHTVPGLSLSDKPEQCINSYTRKSYEFTVRPQITSVHIDEEPITVELTQQLEYYFQTEEKPAPGPSFHNCKKLYWKLVSEAQDKEALKALVPPKAMKEVLDIGLYPAEKLRTAVESAWKDTFSHCVVKSVQMPAEGSVPPVIKVTLEIPQNEFTREYGLFCQVHRACEGRYNYDKDSQLEIQHQIGLLEQLMLRECEVESCLMNIWLGRDEAAYPIKRIGLPVVEEEKPSKYPVRVAVRPRVLGVRFLDPRMHLAQQELHREQLEQQQQQQQQNLKKRKAEDDVRNDDDDAKRPKLVRADATL